MSQRRIKERYYDTRISSTKTEDDDEESDNDDDEHTNEKVDEVLSGAKTEKLTAIDRWTFSATHLKLFMEELQRIDPKFGRNKRAIAYAIRRAKQTMNSKDDWSKVDIAHLGAALLSIMIETATVNHNGKEEPAFRIEKRWSRDEKSKSYVVLNDNLHKLFLKDDFISWAANTTRYTPMIVPPTDWVGPKGGYRWLNADLMRTHGSNMQKEALQHCDLSLVYDGLNILGKTAWKINKDILKVAHYCWENDIAIGDIPSRTDFDLPLEPLRPGKVGDDVDIESPEAQAAIAAGREYRVKMIKRQKIYQKNMVCIFGCF